MLRADLQGGWSYRRVVTAPEPGESPDEAARRACGLGRDETISVLHSTSWRYTPHGQVVLTYAVCPDHAPELPAVELPTLELARGGAPATPSPDRLEVDSVAAHAINHLAFLLKTDRVVGETFARSPEIAMALSGVPLAVAGKLEPGRV
ncbi:hypothetical protein [Sphaerisporangium fuscum]|uniref:hypothetical protein n=1 Tax=Sphaerisporangium fuscum TaxID=2835868 RepID=UPI001BDBEC4A|nr:hypothetical protein [Sphaerisporangium fuscum]